MTTNSALEYWPAPVAHTPVRASVHVPASKSLTNRYLTLATLAALNPENTAPTVLHNPLASRDSDLMVQALAAMGITMTEAADGSWQFNRATKTEAAAQGQEAAAPVYIECGLAGTVMRFAPVLAALIGGDYIFDGDPGARVRPMSELLSALAQQGVELTQLDEQHNPITCAAGQEMTLPFRLRSTGSLPGGTVTLDSTATSQYITALLFLGVGTESPLTIVHTGAKVPSPDHIDMTVQLLAEHGISVAGRGPRWTVTPGRIAGFTTTVEPDLSNAGPFLAAAVVTGGTVSVPHWPARTTQVGDQWRTLLPRFGARVEFTPDAHDSSVGTLTVTGSSEQDPDGRVSFPGGGTISDASELAPTLAAIAALANSPTTLTGIAHLRGHETDRLAALTTEINALGGSVVETADGLQITPAPLQAGDFGSYHDHRMATAGAIIGLAVPGIRVENIATTAKTMPDFPQLWADMVGETATAESGS
ncbi:3-phosphoshikimate 1-carboxyvinyltransferase [Micrococcoides hystricis]|uniref:3-phosphoshikimate 1-carboxyvinyltransferase n=1 Tax=Micrococcoides hystricis TaxID=1572761 RepID=A0ABV6PBQ2_9MICC